MRLLPVVFAAFALAVPAHAADHLVQVGNFNAPVYVAATATEPAAIYVVEQDGRIVRVEGGRQSTFLDIRSKVLSGGEQGLLSVEFNPNYGKNRLFYIDYTALNGNTVIAEYRAGGPRPTQTRVLANFSDPASNHNGGQLEFGPDGLLWWGNGDGGGGGDEFGNSQRVTGNFAKIKRLDVDARTLNWKTWAIGLRNPWRFSFDRKTRDLYIADVGQNEWEEIDFVRWGSSHLNFGWNRYEGRAVYAEQQTLVPDWRYVAPVYVYRHGNDGCSVTGGYVYRGTKVPGAAGRYFFGDYCSGRVWSMRVVGGRATSVRREPFDVASLSSFGEDAHGELYLTSLGGPVYRLAG
jgi:glucose/arabinose dehydrogenase